MRFPTNIHLFCRVVDNYGDVGVCWRLARQFASEYSICVALWVDNLASFQKICPDVDPQCDEQQVQDVSVRRWDEDFGAVGASDVADLVIEAFGCELPATYLGAMAMREPSAVWLNLEYLSAEPWVESCHAMASHHPSLPLTKHFFFPGFSAKTGGLLVERDVSARRTAFQRDAAANAAFLAGLGAQGYEDARKISLFCYPNAPLEGLFDALQADARPTICFVPEGVASEAVGVFLGRPAQTGASVTRDSLTVLVLPFVAQPDYDKLLWACDLNFVRGEDSFVRAQWAARPFIWQIYPQEEGAHWPKLSAFLDRYRLDMAGDAIHALADAWQAWNGAGDMRVSWPALREALPQVSHHARYWERQLARHGDLASNLIQYVQKIC